MAGSGRTEAGGLIRALSVRTTKTASVLCVEVDIEIALRVQKAEGDSDDQ